jgi:hypothetical protein
MTPDWFPVAEVYAKRSYLKDLIVRLATQLAEGNASILERESLRALWESIMQGRVENGVSAWQREGSGDRRAKSPEEAPPAERRKGGVHGSGGKRPAAERGGKKQAEPTNAFDAELQLLNPDYKWGGGWEVEGGRKSCPGAPLPEHLLEAAAKGGVPSEADISVDLDPSSPLKRNGGSEAARRKGVAGPANVRLRQGSGVVAERKESSDGSESPLARYRQIPEVLAKGGGGGLSPGAAEVPSTAVGEPDIAMFEARGGGDFQAKEHVSETDEESEERPSRKRGRPESGLLPGDRDVSDSEGAFGGGRKRVRSESMEAERRPSVDVSLGGDRSAAADQRSERSSKEEADGSDSEDVRKSHDLDGASEDGGLEDGLGLTFVVGRSESGGAPVLERMDDVTGTGVPGTRMGKEGGSDAGQEDDSQKQVVVHPAVGELHEVEELDGVPLEPGEGWFGEQGLEGPEGRGLEERERSAPWEGVAEDRADGGWEKGVDEGGAREEGAGIVRRGLGSEGGATEERDEDFPGDAGRDTWIALGDLRAKMRELGMGRGDQVGWGSEAPVGSEGFGVSRQGSDAFERGSDVSQDGEHMPASVRRRATRRRSASSERVGAKASLSAEIAAEVARVMRERGSERSGDEKRADGQSERQTAMEVEGEDQLTRPGGKSPWRTKARGLASFLEMDIDGGRRGDWESAGRDEHAAASERTATVQQNAELLAEELGTMGGQELLQKAVQGRQNSPESEGVGTSSEDGTGLAGRRVDGRRKEYSRQRSTDEILRSVKRPRGVSLDGEPEWDVRKRPASGRRKMEAESEDDEVAFEGELKHASREGSAFALTDRDEQRLKKLEDTLVGRARAEEIGQGEGGQGETGSKPDSLLAGGVIEPERKINRLRARAVKELLSTSFEKPSKRKPSHGEDLQTEARIILEGGEAGRAGLASGLAEEAGFVHRVAAGEKESLTGTGVPASPATGALSEGGDLDQEPLSQEFARESERGWSRSVSPSDEADSGEAGGLDSRSLGKGGRDADRKQSEKVPQERGVTPMNGQTGAWSPLGGAGTSPDSEELYRKAAVRGAQMPEGGSPEEALLRARQLAGASPQLMGAFLILKSPPSTWEGASGAQNPLGSGSLTPLASETPNPLAFETPNPLTSGIPNPLASGIPNPLASGTPNTLASGTPNPLASGALKGVMEKRNERTEEDDDCAIVDRSPIFGPPGPQGTRTGATSASQCAVLRSPHLGGPARAGEKGSGCCVRSTWAASEGSRSVAKGQGKGDLVSIGFVSRQAANRGRSAGKAVPNGMADGGSLAGFEGPRFSGEDSESLGGAGGVNLWGGLPVERKSLVGESWPGQLGREHVVGDRRDEVHQPGGEGDEEAEVSGGAWTPTRSGRKGTTLDDKVEREEDWHSPPGKAKAVRSLEELGGTEAQVLDAQTEGQQSRDDSPGRFVGRKQLQQRNSANAVEENGRNVVDQAERVVTPNRIIVSLDSDDEGNDESKDREQRAGGISDRAERRTRVQAERQERKKSLEELEKKKELSMSRRQLRNSGQL